MDGVCLTSKLRAIERSQCIVHRGLCFEFINIQVSEVKNCADASGSVPKRTGRIMVRWTDTSDPIIHHNRG